MFVSLMNRKIFSKNILKLPHKTLGISRIITTIELLVLQ